MLAQPLIIEVLEDNFIPVAIYNNVGGSDKVNLKRFQEPAWNYQVMRFMDANLKDVIPRKDKVWDVHGTATRIASALKANGKKVPTYLQNIVIPESNRNLKTVAFAMYCFWTGEAKLGALDGVISTEAGFFDGHEVVVLKYDPKTVTLPSLVGEAEKLDCAKAVYVPKTVDQRLVSNRTRLKNVKLFNATAYRKAPAGDQKRQVRSNRKLAKLGLSPMQWTKLNSARVSKTPAFKWLSPRQIAMLKSK